MVMAGLVLLAVGLVTGRLPVLVIGGLLLVLGVLAEGAQFLDLDLIRGRLILKRETVEEAMLRRAAEKGISDEEARRVAALIAARVPEEGAEISIAGGNQATAALEKGSVAFVLPEGEKLDEDLLAELFVDQRSKELLRNARLRDVIRKAGYGKVELEDTLLHPGPRSSETIELAKATADELFDAAGKVDITKTLLIYPSGRYAIQTVELTAGEMTIGREESCDIVLDDPAASSVHALLRVGSRGEVKIVDNDSTNGVFVNKEKVGVRTLRNRDLIDIGGRIFLFVEPSDRPGTGDELSTG
jgi:hypothetical protein